MSLTIEKFEALLDKKFSEFEALALTPIRESIDSVKASLLFLSSQYADISKSVKNLSERNKVLQVENASLRSQLLTMTNDINQQKDSLNDFEQYSRRECLEISGIPKKIKEDTNQIVIDIGQMLGVEITEDDLSVSHRLPPNKRNPDRPPSDVNFNYYSSSDFRNNKEISDCLSENAFSFLHCYIRSLSANKNNLKHLLYELNCSFTLIALTETKLAVANDSLSNLNLHGYQFLSQPSLSNAGGVGFYVRDNYNFSVRSDLSITESGFEALWIEVENNTQSNSLCGVIYRHPHGNIDSFMEYLNSSIEKTHRENKV